jgi:hypothetical protein
VAPAGVATRGRLDASAQALCARRAGDGGQRPSSDVPLTSLGYRYYSPASVGVAVLDKERALERRRQRVRGAVKQAHRNLLVELETGVFGELGQRTLRQWLTARSKEVVTSTVSGWERAISGNLDGGHYWKLGAACTAHLQLIGEAIDALSAADESISHPEGAITGGDLDPNPGPLGDPFRRWRTRLGCGSGARRAPPLGQLDTATRSRPAQNFEPMKGWGVPLIGVWQSA